MNAGAASRIWRCWLLAERTCAKLAFPRIDVAEADRKLEALARESWLWCRSEALFSSINAGWLDSRCRRLLGLGQTGRS